MATTAELAAQARKDALYNEYMSQQGNTLSDAYNQQVSAAQAATQNNLDQLTQAAQKYQDTYNEDTRSAYINKMQNDQNVDNELTRMGLSNSGYGVTQKLMSAAEYGKNVTGLQKNLANNLANIDMQKSTANVGLQQTLADLASNYANAKTSENQWLANYLQNAYDAEYKRVYQSEQDAIANQIAMARAYSSGGSGGSGSYASGVVEYGELADFYGDGKGNMIYIDNNGNKYKMKQNYNPYTGTINPDAKKGTFANGYQPDNYKGYKLSKTGDTKGGQNIWKYTDKNDKEHKVYWDGQANRYYAA